MIKVESISAFIASFFIVDVCSETPRKAAIKM
jgi:hypothetical protein